MQCVVTVHKCLVRIIYILAIVKLYTVNSYHVNLTNSKYKLIQLTSDNPLSLSLCDRG